MNEFGCVPIKIYLRKQLIDQIWPMGCCLPVLVLEDFNHFSPTTFSPIKYLLRNLVGTSKLFNLQWLIEQESPHH